MSDVIAPSMSVWMTTEEMPRYPRLAADAVAEVCVVGGGITGLMTAYLLAKEGKTVVLLDRDTLGSGQTGRTTAHLSTALDRRYYELQRLHSKEGACLAAASHATAIDRIEDIVRDEHIDCQFERVDGFLVRAGREWDQGTQAGASGGAGGRFARRRICIAGAFGRF